MQNDVTTQPASWGPRPKIHCYTTLIDKLVLTWYAASLMNCLAFCLQIAGTVTTHLTSSLRISDPVASLNSMRAWFRKYRRVMEKTVRAVKDLPLAARILVSSPISWNLFLRFLSRLLTIWLQQNNRQTLYLQWAIWLISSLQWSFSYFSCRFFG